MHHVQLQAQYMPQPVVRIMLETEPTATAAVYRCPRRHAVLGQKQSGDQLTNSAPAAARCIARAARFRMCDFGVQWKVM